MSAEEIIKAFEKVQKCESKMEEVKAYNPSEAQKSKDSHQFVFFLKPEATTAPAKLKPILDLVFSSFASNNIDIHAIRAIGGEYLDEKDIMVEHYGVIAAISKNGKAAISDAAKVKLAELFPNHEKAKVLGGHQFLKEYPEFTPYSLCVLNDNLGTKRLAGGTYAMGIKVMGEDVIVLNPFHAYQLVPFTKKGNGIIVMECRSSVGWEKLRNDVCGVTDPKAANEGSIRRNLFLKKAETGMVEVSKGSNGVHMSAGPLEGMVELQRFFGLKAEETCFGALLGSSGFEGADVEKLRGNPDFEDGGKNVSAFDLTEEKDVKESVQILKTKMGK